jgi:hypothetical protein
MYRQMIRYLPVLAVGLAVATPTYAQARREGERGNHPRLHAALTDLREARAELKDARDDFVGRRDQSLTAVDDAAKSIRLILCVKTGTTTLRYRRNRLIVPSTPSCFIIHWSTAANPATVPTMTRRAGT